MPAGVDARRDQYGRYLVVPPGGGRPTGYTRATTVAKSLDDGGGLIPWKAALAMTGMMRRPGLRGRFEALLSAHPDAGPWYGSPDSKTAVKALVEECAEAGGASDRADLGTALHAICEQINRGETPTITQDSTRADVDAYRVMLAETGITFDVDAIEATVVLDDWKVAGTADVGCAHIPGLGDVIADLKTGANLDYSWQSIAVQLAVYAHGDNLYRQGVKPDGSDDRRFPVPNVRRDIAVVIHLPAGEARCRLYRVNIAAGWEAFEHSMWARRWRARKDLAEPLHVETSHDATDRDVGQLLARVTAMPAEARQVLKDSWPAHLPPLKRPEWWNTQLVEECARMVDAAEQTGSTTPSPSAAARPTVDEWTGLTDEQRADRATRGQIPDAYRADPARIAELRAELEALTDTVIEWVEEHAVDAGVPHFDHAKRWTVDHVEVLAALIADADGQHAAGTPGEVYDWPKLVADAGITKAACQRQAKTIAVDLGIEKLPATIQRYPTDGAFAARLAAWIAEQHTKEAVA